MKEKYRKKIRSSQQKKANSVFSKKEKASRRKITGWRLWLFRFVAVIFIPALLILALEFVLRLTGYGYEPAAIIKCRIKDKKAYRDNDKFAWLFFPPNIAREFTPFVFPSQKTETTYRIFVFGASAAQGAPDSAYSFSRILEVILSEQYPVVNFEIINTAMTAINSHVVVEIAEDCALYEPDLFVVYLGNNEVIGPYGAGTVFAPLSEHLSLIRLGISFRGTRLGQLLTYLLQATNRNIPKVWGGMGMFADKQLSADDEKLQIVYNNYNRNLETVIKIAKKGNPEAIKFPRSMLGKDSLDFSFSGIKTAVLYYCRGQDMKGENKVDSMREVQIADIAASFQAAVIDVLVEKTKLAAEKTRAKTILLGGGVAANSSLRGELQKMCNELRPAAKLFAAEKQYCTDNAVMVASLAYHKYKAGIFADLTVEPKAHSE
ncbi:tRNA N6-adenosine threonylcarbamoyltransferase [subsurface metagenome]